MLQVCLVQAARSRQNSQSQGSSSTRQPSLIPRARQDTENTLLPSDELEVEQRLLKACQGMKEALLLTNWCSGAAQLRVVLPEPPWASLPWQFQVRFALSPGAFAVLAAPALPSRWELRAQG